MQRLLLFTLTLVRSSVCFVRWGPLFLTRNRSHLPSQWPRAATNDGSLLPPATNLNHRRFFSRSDPPTHGQDEQPRLQRLPFFAYKYLRARQAILPRCYIVFVRFPLAFASCRASALFLNAPYQCHRFRPHSTRLKLKLIMRYQHWDVLVFPERSKVPLQEFKTQCLVTKDHGRCSPTYKGAYIH
jgi:hypothetical protein